MFLLTTNPSKIVARLNIVTRLTAVITLLLLPLVVQAQAPTVPSSSNGNYSVTWNAYYMFLEEKVGSGSWGSPAGGTLGTNTISFASKASGTYSYRAARIEFYPYFHLFYSPVATTTVIAIQPPSNLTSPANDSDGVYTVSWNTVSGATQYQLQEKIGSGSWATVQSTSANSKAFSGKTNNSYQYRVNACSTVCSPYSAIKTTTVLHKPGIPGGISAPAIDNDGNFSISWSASSGVVSSYKLQQQINGSGNWTTIQNTSAQSKSFSNLSTSDYQFQVQGCNSSGCGYFTPAVTVTVGSNGGTVSNDAFYYIL